MQKKNKSTEYFAYLNPDNNQAQLPGISMVVYQKYYFLFIKVKFLNDSILKNFANNQINKTVDVSKRSLIIVWSLFEIWTNTYFNKSFNVLICSFKYYT